MDSSSSPQSEYFIWTWIAPRDYERADRALLEAAENQDEPRLSSLTRSQLKRLMEEGHITGNGLPLKSSSRLKAGTLVQAKIPPPREIHLTPENRPLDILYEDEYLVVINKPPGLTVHPASSQPEGTLVHALLHHIKDLSGIGGVLRPGIVHRIDKNTSGALVVTKTDAAHTALAEAFSRHNIERAYWALCYGSPESSSNSNSKKTRIESLIGRNPKDRKKMSMNVKDGRKAITYFQKLEEYALPKKKPFAAWLEVTLETGRTHQVRVHLTGIGHSLLADPVYGVPSTNQPKWQALPDPIKKIIASTPGQALHARVLGFQHPITGQPLRFEAKPPESFQNLLDALRRYQ